MKPSDIPLPKEWPTMVKSAILQVISLAHYSMTYTRSWCANSRISRLRLKSRLETAEQEIAYVIRHREQLEPNLIIIKIMTGKPRPF